MLVPSIEHALVESGWPKSSLSCLVVGLGPGSFTGIRTAIVTAKTLAQALALPLLGVSYLQCLGWQGRPPLAVVLSGAPGSFFIAAYGQAGEEQVAPAYSTQAEVEDLLRPFERWIADEPAAGSFQARGRECEPLPVLENIAVTQAQIALDRLSLRVPQRLSAEERQKLAEEYSWRQVEPLYLRGPSVTVKKSNAN